MYNAPIAIEHPVILKLVNAAGALLAKCGIRPFGPDAESAARQCTTWVAPLPVEFPVNEFLPPWEFEAEQGAWDSVDNIYGLCRFRLAEDEYLKVRLRSPEACYWGCRPGISSCSQPTTPTTRSASTSRPPCRKRTAVTSSS